MFNHVVVAGAFDHLHLGHKQLLETAQQSGRQVLVGLCQEQMLIHKSYQPLIENYSVRQKNVSQFLSSQPSEIFPLFDIYGPAAEIGDLDAIVCTNQTQPNVDKINRLRQLRALKPLTAIVVDLIPSSDRQILSSTRIRQGLVSRTGFAYQQIFPKNALTLPGIHRHYFQKPFAQIIKTVVRQPAFLTVAVGDIAVISLLRQKIRLDLAIVDLKTKRRQIFSRLEDLGLKPGLTAVNPPAQITQDLVKKLLCCFSAAKQTLLVKGEEDLAVLPAILLCPLKTTIFYGQPNQGLVKIFVTEKTKAKAAVLLQKLI